MWRVAQVACAFMYDIRSHPALPGAKQTTVCVAVQVNLSGVLPTPAAKGMRRWLLPVCFLRSDRSAVL